MCHRRTDNSQNMKLKQGVAAPSQIRYVGYIEQILHYNVDHISPRPVILNKVWDCDVKLYISHPKQKMGLWYCIQVILNKVWSMFFQDLSS
jgi:hypothetical protein